MVAGETKEQKLLWVQAIYCYLNWDHLSEGNKISLLFPHMKCMPPLDNMNAFLRDIYAKWNKNDEAGHDVK